MRAAGGRLFVLANLWRGGKYMEQLYTRWGKALDPNDILQEYPRPLLRRDSYINLNGYWDYAFTNTFKIPEKYDGIIAAVFVGIKIYKEIKKTGNL